MTHDLREVLRNPLRFMASLGKGALQEPFAIPAKTLNYAQYDAVQLFNELMDRVGVRRSLVERLVNRALAVPVSYFLRMKRGISLPVLDRRGRGDWRDWLGHLPEPDPRAVAGRRPQDAHAARQVGPLPLVRRIRPARPRCERSGLSDDAASVPWNECHAAGFSAAFGRGSVRSRLVLEDG